MKHWLRQLLIGTVAIFTLGVISPSHEIWANVDEKSEPFSDSAAEVSGENYQVEWQSEYEAPSIDDLYAQAKTVAYTKFGSKIGPKIQNEFDDVIFPEIEKVIAHVYEENRTLAVTENPSGNYSEKMFNVYDAQSGDELLYFHVRTEKRPQEGYYYNFHYHVQEDDFDEHHTIGDIYWSKNTPPKWLS